MDPIIKKLKKDLIKAAKDKPLTSMEVLKKSHELDRHILNIMKEQYENKKSS